MPSAVVLTDIRISFFRLVVIMIKVSLAAIPAGIIVGAIYLALAFFLFGGMFGGLMPMLR